MNFDFYGKKFLLAGGTGFVGKRVTAYLVNAGAEVYIITRSIRSSNNKVHYLTVDLNDIETLRKIECNDFDACVYMAAYIPEIGQKKESYLDAKKSTLDPLVNFCECFTSRVKFFVYISSIDVLGPNHNLYYDEMEEIHTATPYGLAKLCGELYVKSYCEQNSVPWNCLRFSQVYGSFEPVVRVIPIMKNSLQNGLPFSLYSDGKEKRRFLYVDDGVQAIACALNSKAVGVYNIAGKTVSTMEELAHTMENVYGRKLQLNILNNIVGEDNVPSIKKAEDVLGFIPKVSLENGLETIKREESYEIIK